MNIFRVHIGEHRLLGYNFGPAPSADIGLGNSFERGRWTPRPPNARAAERIGQFNGAQTIRIGLQNGTRPLGFSTHPAFRNYRPYRPMNAPTAAVSVSFGRRYNGPSYSPNSGSRGGFGAPHPLDEHLQTYPRSYPPYPDVRISSNNRPARRPTVRPVTIAPLYVSAAPVRYQPVSVRAMNTWTFVGDRAPGIVLPPTFPDMIPNDRTPASAPARSASSPRVNAPSSTIASASSASVNRPSAAASSSRESELKRREDVVSRLEDNYRRNEAFALKNEQELQQTQKRSAAELETELSRLQTETKQRISEARESLDKRIAALDPTLPNAVELIRGIGEEFTKTEALLRTQQEQGLKKIREQFRTNTATITTRLETVQKQLEQIRKERQELAKQREEIRGLSQQYRNLNR